MKNKMIILVGLDLSEMDNYIYGFLSEFAEKFPPDKIIFTHIIPTEEIPEEIEEYFPDLDQPLEKIVQEDISDSLNEYFTPSTKVPYEIVVKHGERADEILAISDKYKAELIVLGLKQELRGTGISLSRVAAFANSSTLFVPENAKPGLSQLLAIINFDKISQLMLQKALEMGKQTGGDIHALHIYGLPINYFKKSPTQALKDELVKECKKKFSKWIKKVNNGNVNIDCEFLLDEKNDKASIILRYIRKINVDMLFMSLKDSSDNSAFYIRTITEKLRIQKMNLPLWIYKEKKVRGFL